jgi:hypothetical protein
MNIPLNKLLSKQLLIAILLAVVVGLTMSSLGIVWMRQQISSSAKLGTTMEVRLSQVARNLAAIEAQIALIHHPQALQQTIAGNTMSDSKIVWVNDPSSSADVRIAYNAHSSYHPELSVSDNNHHT